MSVEIVGMIGVKREGTGAKGTEVHVIGGGIDPDYIVQFARAHEESGFDKALVGYTSTSADGFAVAMHAAAHTTKLGYLIAHRPGFLSPTLAARKVATIDHITKGRIALHIISGGGDAEQRRDGDFLDHDSRYRRSGEFMHLLRRVWTEDEPFDHEGEYYRVEQAWSDLKCYQQPHVPLYFGGASKAALNVAAEQCNVYAIWGEPVSEVENKISLMRQTLKETGRDPSTVGFSVSLRPILGTTEPEAWDRAHAILDNVLETGQRSTIGLSTSRLQSEGSRRLLEFAGQGDVLDERLYMPIAKATGAAGNTTALVGTAEQVVESLMRYYKAGCTTILIRGFDPLNDAVEYGRELIPMLRDSVRKYVKARERSKSSV